MLSPTGDGAKLQNLSTLYLSRAGILKTVITTTA